MIQVVITWRVSGEFNPVSYVCTPEAAFNLWFHLHDTPAILSIKIKSMNGTPCKMTEHGHPLHGMQSLYDLASACNVK